MLCIRHVFTACLHMDSNFGDVSRGVSEAASHREKNAENDLRSDVEG